MNTSQYQKLLIVADNHGRFINKKVEAQLFQFKAQFKPDTTIHLGDNFDFSCLRSAASANERKDDLVEDVSAGLEFLERLRPDHLCWGNHDKRVLEYLHGFDYGRSIPNRAHSSLEEYGASELYQKIAKMIDKLRIKTVAYGIRNSLKIGKWNFAHGYSHCDVPAKNMAQLFGNVIFGDIHHFSQYTTKTPERFRGYSVGSLCRDEDMYYQLSQPASLRHENGWAYGYLNPRTGDFKFEEARQVGGIFICPTL